jgi:hypothetical protein
MVFGFQFMDEKAGRITAKSCLSIYHAGMVSRVMRIGRSWQEEENLFI